MNCDIHRSATQLILCFCSVPVDYYWFMYNDFKGIQGVVLFQEYISFHLSLAKTQYIEALESYHDNSKEDQQWKFTCCSAPSQATRDCRLTAWLSQLTNWMENMDFQASNGEVITGVFSHYAPAMEKI